MGLEPQDEAARFYIATENEGACALCHEAILPGDTYTILNEADEETPCAHGGCALDAAEAIGEEL